MRKELSFGLDIGDQSLKALQFQTHQNKPRLKGFAEITLPPGLIQGGEILKPEEIAKHIKTATQKARIFAKNVVIALPEAKTFIKLLNIPISNSTSANQLIQDELAHHLPFEIDEVWWDFKIIKQQENQLLALVGAAPKQLINTYIKLLDLADLVPVALDLEPLAIARALIKANTAPTCTMIVDLGATKSTLIVTAQNAIIATADGHSAGNQLTEQLAKKLGINSADAQEMKHKFGLASDNSEYLEVIKAYTDSLITRVKETINFTHTHNPDYPAVSEIILSGGGALLKKLPEALSTALKIPARIADPWVNTKLGPSSTTACGLALTALGYDHTN